MDGTLDTQTPAQVAANIENIRGSFGGSHLDDASASRPRIRDADSTAETASPTRAQIRSCSRRRPR